MEYLRDLWSCVFDTSSCVNNLITSSLYMCIWCEASYCSQNYHWLFFWGSNRPSFYRAWLNKVKTHHSKEQTIIYRENEKIPRKRCMLGNQDHAIQNPRNSGREIKWKLTFSESGRLFVAWWQAKIAKIGWNFAETQRNEHTRLHVSLFQFISRYCPKVGSLFLCSYKSHTNPLYMAPLCLGFLWYHLSSSIQGIVPIAECWKLCK